MNEAAKWYVIHTYSGYEKLVVENINKVINSGSLNDLILEARVPVEKVKELRNGKMREIERKLFPGYVIVKMVLNDDSWLAIKKVKGVTGFVGDAYNPNCLSQKEVDKLGFENKKVEVDYKVGDMVKINSGAFEGFSGKVEEIDLENLRVKVIVSVFGRNTPIEVSVNSVVLK